MPSLKKSALLVLFAMLVLVLIPMSFAADAGVDADLAADDTADVDVAAADDSEPLNVGPGDAAYVQGLIDSATTNNIDLSAYDTYDFGNNSVLVNKDNLIISGNGNTVIKANGGWTDANKVHHNSTFVVQAKNVTFTGIKFIDTNPNNNLTYGGNIEGYGIQFIGDEGADACKVISCDFSDFESAVYVGQTHDVLIKDCNFYGGIATLLINDPSVNKEKGSKVINAMGANRLNIINNYFEGPALDAISIASGSKDAFIQGNIFNGSAYAIFFGGASTSGTFIKDNTFLSCGAYKDATHDYSGFAVISIEKASNGIYIDNNTFYVVNDNMLIKAEQGNTAHGSPSTLGDINVTNNKVTPADATNFVGSSVTLLHINCKNSVLNPYAPITVTGNNLTKGVRALVVWSTEWGTEDAYNKKTGEDISNVIVPKADLIKTQIADVAIGNDGTVTGKLMDTSANKGINAAEITYTAAGATKSVTTDKNGLFTITGVAGQVEISFASTDKYAATALNATVPTAIASAVKVDDLKVLAGDTGKLKITLKDANGNAITGVVSVIIDGVAKQVSVNNGAATLDAKYATAGTHYVTAYFSGEGYASSISNAKITVSKKATKLTAAKATLKAKVAKKVTVTLKSGSAAVAGKKVTIKVAGKTFSAKTNAKGIAYVPVKVLKKGSFVAVVGFAGDGAYNAAKAVKVRFVVK